MWRITIALLIIVTSCSSNKTSNPVKLLGEAQGTYYSIIYFDKQNRDFKVEIDSLLDDFDLSVSLWVPESILSRVNKSNQNINLDKHFTDNFNLSEKVAIETDGAFDFTVGSLVKAWGFGFDNRKNIDSLIIDSLLQYVGYNKVKIVNNHIIKQDTNTTFDFNAIAQGYSVDLVAEFLQKNNISDFLIDIGGEVRAVGKKPNGDLWKIGIEKPTKNATDERVLTATIVLKNLSIATSGSYRKFFEEDGVRYSHTINPSTGYPVVHSLLSASIICNNTALADAYATACMVMGLDESISFVENNPDLEAFFIYSNKDGSYETYATDGFTNLIVKKFD